MSLPSENLETVLLSTFPAVPIALDSPRTYYKVVYDKLTPAGIIIALNDQLIVGTILQALKDYEVAEMLMIKRFKNTVKPIEYETVILFTFEGKHNIPKLKFRFADYYADFHNVLRMCGPDKDDSELKIVIRKTVEAYRYVRGKDITDLMDIVRSRIKQEDDAIERERLEKERLKAERKAVRKERKLNQLAERQREVARRKEQKEERRALKQQQEQQQRKESIITLKKPRKVRAPNKSRLERKEEAPIRTLDFYLKKPTEEDPKSLTASMSTHIE